MLLRHNHPILAMQPFAKPNQGHTSKLGPGKSTAVGSEWTRLKMARDMSCLMCIGQVERVGGACRALSRDSCGLMWARAHAPARAGKMGVIL